MRKPLLAGVVGTGSGALILIAAAGYTLIMARLAHGTPPAMQAPGARADAILVTKADGRLRLLRQGVVIRRYRIAMGSGWNAGPKRREGDGRTPEGRYVIDRRNARSAAYLSLHISYPREDQRAAARRRGIDPGGAIMIHGLPNGWGAFAAVNRVWNWTDGCIAVDDPAMREIWSLVPTGTPIEIRAR